MPVRSRSSAALRSRNIVDLVNLRAETSQASTRQWLNRLCFFVTRVGLLASSPTFNAFCHAESPVLALLLPFLPYVVLRGLVPRFARVNK